MVAYALPGIFVIGWSVYLMESYVIRCPEQAEWNIRAKIQCQNITKYFCLYNYIHYTYEEGCTGPEWEIPGSKRVYSRNFNSAPCNDTRYQPIKFVTNGNSDCIFRKSLCTEEGQTLFEAGTTRTDSTCRCDYKQGYAFVTVPRNKCSCRPLEEDCSCYLKKCQGIGYYLSADYECTKNGTQKTVCSLMSENLSEDPHIKMASTGTPREYDSYAIKRTYDVAIFVSICFFVMIVITMYIMFQQILPRCTCLSTKQGLVFKSSTETTVTQSRVDKPTIKESSDNTGLVFKSSTETTVTQSRVDKPTIKESSDNTADGNRLEEIASGNNEDYQIASSDGNWKSALDESKYNIDRGGFHRALEHFKKDLDNWRNESVKLAVIGRSGVGKSSFINAIRNLKSDDPDFATSSSSGNTTPKPTVYEYPGNPNITLHDLPAFGTIELPTNGYEKTMELNQYDYILIFVGNIAENDIEIAKKLKEMKKPFCFVRSKIDIDIQNAEDGELEKDIVEKIMSKLSRNLQHAGFNKARFFVISNHNQSIYQFHDLVLYIQSNLPRLKYDALMFSILGKLPVDVIDSKYQILEDRLWKIVMSHVLVFNMNIEFAMTLICKELLLYHKTFGFEQQFVQDILKYDCIRQKLNVRSIIEIQPTNEAMHTFVKIELEKFGISLAREDRNNFILSFMLERVTFKLLIQVLDGCRDDAMLVYSCDECFKSTEALTMDGDMTLTTTYVE